MSAIINLNDIWLGNHPVLGSTFHIWTQGCYRNCTGCCNEDAHDPEQVNILLRPENLADLILARDCTGIMLSGGEPFLQSTGLAEAFRRVRSVRPKILIIAYTGYRMEELLGYRSTNAAELLKEIDLLIDGPFLIDRISDNPLIGSDNQRLFRLSKRIELKVLMKPYPPVIGFSLDDKRNLRVVGTGKKGLDMKSLINAAAKHGVVLDER